MIRNGGIISGSITFEDIIYKGIRMVNYSGWL